MNDDVIKSGPGRQRTQNSVEEALRLHSPSANTPSRSAEGVPTPAGVESLDTANREYLEQKSAATHDSDAIWQQFLSAQGTNILPTIPHDESYRYCWLTTMEKASDNVHTRQRQGWVLVTWDDIEHLGVSKASFGTNRAADISDDLVSCNEMVLARIPTQVWERIMKLYHHDAPTDNEQNIYNQAKATFVDKNGESVMQEDSGMVAFRAHRNKKANFKGN